MVLSRNGGYPSKYGHFDGVMMIHHRILGYLPHVHLFSDKNDKTTWEKKQIVPMFHAVRNAWSSITCERNLAFSSRSLPMVWSTMSLKVRKFHSVSV
jgi:hypothetical protein